MNEQSIASDANGVIVRQLGRQPYEPIFEAMKRFTDERDQNTQDEIWLVEHDAVFTQGQAGKAEHILMPGDIPVVQVDRGGQVTYHGPGQLVVYPIVNLKDWGGPVKYVRALEQVVIATLAEMGITANCESGNTGVWTSQGKLAAIGVKISRGIAFHGFAINVNTDLAYYQNIIPCGIADRPVTSMASILGQPVDMELVRYGMVYQFGREFGWRMEDGALA